MPTLAAPSSLSDADYRRVVRVVYDHCGIDLSQGDGKKELVQARLTKGTRAGGHASPAAYLEGVLAEPGSPAFRDLIDSLTTNLTSFYRERQHFDYLTDAFLPPLLQHKRRVGDRRVRAWCAGCSTGEEAYTLGMILLDAVAAPSSGGGWDAKLLASDISRRVLRIAAEGRYDEAKARPVPPGPRGRYLDELPSNRAVRAGSSLRAVLRFRYLNLMEPWPFSGPFDFIFCRNVMIYFDKPTQERLVNRYFGCLAPGGLLFTGHSESLGKLSHHFEYVQPAVYRRP